MVGDQMLAMMVLAATMALLISNRWRYDVVAVMGLLAAVVLGVVPADRAFAGLGHPAVITVAAVLVMSQALQRSGIVDYLATLIASIERGPHAQIGLTCAVTALLSAFMNNVGALALMLPVALRNAGRTDVSPSVILMPLAFASLLGGLVTMIGTPPNIVIAAARAKASGTPFGMFDFTPVGLTVALTGLIFVVVASRYMVPERRRHVADGDRYHIKKYLIETKILPASPLVGRDVGHLESLCQNEATVMAMIRGSRRYLAPKGSDLLQAEDVLILQGDPLALRPVLEGRGLMPVGDQGVRQDLLTSEDVRMVEAVVMPAAPIEGRSMRRLRMHETYGINLLAMARQGQPPAARLAEARFEIGDVLLLQGHVDHLKRVLPMLGCLPLAERGLNLHQPTWSWLPLGIFVAAVIIAATGLISVPIAFVAAVLAMVLTNAIPAREIYSCIEWPVVILLGSLIPIGEALETTGTTELIADAIGALAGGMPIWGILALFMATSMLLSDLIHNTPTAVLMAPIGATLAQNLGLPTDALLMAIAVGSASPYLTPIGHQSNTLVMGPGQYRFGDYWRLGLPLDMVILMVAVPMILWMWTP